MDVNLAIVCVCAVLLVAIVSVPWGAAVALLSRAGAAELALEQRRVAELELEVATLEAQAEAGHAAASDVLLVERKLAAVRARGGDRAAGRRGLLLAGAGDGGPAAAAGGGAGGPDGAAAGPAGPLA